MSNHTNQKITTVVIPIAGYGSRMFPETLLVNKALLPIGNKPSIIHIIEEVVTAKIPRIIIIISPSQVELKNHLKPIQGEILERFPNNDSITKFNNLINQVKIEYVIQEHAKGLGDAIYQAKALLKENEAFGVILGDNVITKHESYGIDELVMAFNHHNANYIGVIKVSDEETKLYGIVQGPNIDSATKKFKIDQIIEKPTSNPPSNYACLGRYVFNYSIFKYLDDARKENQELILPEAIDLALLEEEVLGIKLTGKWLDVGNCLGFIKANIDYALHDKELKDKILKYLQENYL